MKLFVSDLDGTLLKSDHKVSHKSKEAIGLLKEAGYEVALASGRVLSSVRYQMEDSGLDCYLIALNGAMTAKGHEIITSYEIDHETLAEIVDICRRFKLNYHFYDDDTFYADKIVPERVEHLKAGGKQVNFFIRENVFDYILENKIPINNILIYQGLDDDENYKRAMDQVEGIYVSKSASSTSDIIKSGVNKWTATVDIGRYLGIDEKDIVCIGDFDNDYEMVKNSGFGIAMGNSVDIVKEAADYVTDSNDNEGFYKAVKYLLEEKDA